MDVRGSRESACKYVNIVCSAWRARGGGLSWVLLEGRVLLAQGSHVERVKPCLLAGLSGGVAFQQCCGSCGEHGFGLRDLLRRMGQATAAAEGEVGAADFSLRLGRSLEPENLAVGGIARGRAVCGHCSAGEAQRADTLCPGQVQIGRYVSMDGAMGVQSWWLHERGLHGLWVHCT